MEAVSFLIYPPPHLFTPSGTNVVGFESLELSGKVPMVAVTMFLSFGQSFILHSHKYLYLHLSSILSWDHHVLNDILIAAKVAYKSAEERFISVHVSDSSNNWRHIASRPKRPLNSIVLDPGIKDLLVNDAKDFLQSKPWYSARGIPFRRGYLLVRFFYHALLS
jgi:hypothetical protein